jgi:uncharacterized RDD family membrane protein YckC
MFRSLQKILFAALLLCALGPRAQDADTPKQEQAAEKPAATDAPLEDRATPVGEEPKVEKTIRAEMDEMDWDRPRRNTRKRPREHHEAIVQIRGDVTVKQGETVGDIVVIAGKLTMDGEVRGSVVSIASETSINGTIRDGLVVVPGPVKIGPKADVGRDTLVVGSYTRDPEAKLEHFHPVEVPEMVPVIGGVKDFLFQGLLMMRPLPPSVHWVWWVHGGMFLALLGLTLLFPKPVRAGSLTIAERPVLSLFSGFLTVILFVPILVLLSITIVGLPVTLIGMLLATFFGKASLMTFIGQQIGRNLNLKFLESPLLAMVVGALVLMGLYTVPVVGMLVWGIATLLGIGAIMVATASALNNRPSEPTPTAYATAPITATAVPGNPIDPSAPLIGPIAAAPAYLHRVGFWKRTLACLLDLFLLAFPMILLGHIAPIILITYFVLMWGWRGTTIGMICLGLKIVRTDGTRIDFAVALVRSLAACFSFAVFLLGFFWAGWDREKQSWHDKIAGTIVVQVPKGVSLL